jgi:hypothetical protein
MLLSLFGLTLAPLPVVAVTETRFALKEAMILWAVGPDTFVE